MIVFDIETGPLPLKEIRHLMPPFNGDAGEFDPASVKCGNLKDPAKIEQKIIEARMAHEALRAALPARLAEHEKQFIERAALSPLTGQVLAVGWKDNDGLYGFTIDAEASLLTFVWKFIGSSASHAPLVGHNIFGFDLPFLVRRSWLLGIDVPRDLLVNGRFWSPLFVDLMHVWGCGSREMVSLDTLAKAMGLGGKPDGIDGGDFAHLLAENRQAAIDYLRNDLELTWQVAARMQVA